MPPIIAEVLTRLDTTLNRAIAAATLAVMLGGLVFYTVRTARRRKARKQLHETIVSASVEYLSNVLVPDGMGGATHVDYLLLTPHGILVIDQRDVRGNIFGGDQMTQWTVMSGARRQTFQNPQHALYDRVAVVKQLAGDDVPVEGRILFTQGSSFPKGLPRWTITLDLLHTQFPPPDSQAAPNEVAVYREGWNALLAAVSSSSLRRGPSFLSEVFRS
ncbi:MAG: NERD domain-containing protein [Nevskiaceae bacterium]|jgi:hypothetical protein|nr:NERD domain-containing protein [Nevskiaceae bacterium]